MTPQPIERIPVFRCTVKGCPWPKNQEMHRPWCLGIPGVRHGEGSTHQHWPKKGMGGKRKESRIVAILCPFCHDRIDNGSWGNAANHFPGKGLTYYAWDLNGETVIERVLEAESSAVEAGVTPQSGNQALPSAALPPASKAESAAAEGEVKPAEATTTETPDTVLGSEAGSLASVRGSSAAAPSALVIPGTMTETSLTLPQNLSFEDWSDGVKKLSEFGHHYQFFLGDAIIFGEDRFGEEAWQTLDCLGLQPESIGNIVRVCRAIPPPSRHGDLKYSHHVVTYKLPPEERDKWLDVAEANQWSIREFRENVRGKPSRKKRWSLEELNTLLNEFGPSRLAWEFLDTLKGLEEQGE